MNTKTLIVILTIILITLGILIFQGIAEKNNNGGGKTTLVPTTTSIPTPTPTTSHVLTCPAQLICYVSTTKLLCKKNNAAVAYMTCDAGAGEIGNCCPAE